MPNQKSLTNEQLKRAIAKSVNAHKTGQTNTESKNMTFSLPTKSEAQKRGSKQHLRKV